MTRRSTSSIRSIGANGRASATDGHAYRGESYARLPEPGWSIAHTAPRQKIVATVLGVNQSNVSRQIHGEQSGALDEAHEIVRRAVRERASDAGHLIAGFMLTAVEAAADLPVPEIVARLLEALAQETAFECAENRAEQRLCVALGCLHAEPTSAQLRELRSALEAHDHASRREIGRQIDAVLYNRALRRVYGWMEAP